MFPRIKLFIDKYNNINIAVRASLWFAICSILQKGISVVTMPIFTRLMDTSQYGKYSIFQTWYNIFFIIITLNIQSEIFNKGLIDHSDEKDSFSSNMIGLLITLTSFFILLYIIFRPYINRLLGLPTYLVIVMVFEILANAIFGLWSARKRFDFKYKEIVAVTVVMSILNPIVGIVAVYFSTNKAEARIISNALIPVLLSFFFIASFSRKNKLFGNFMWWKAALISSFPLLPHYLSLVLLNQSDKLMINHFIGVNEAGIYSVAHSAGLLMTIINNSINGSFVPWAYEKMKRSNGDGIRNISNMLFGIVMVANLALIWFAPETVGLLATSEYHDAIWCLVPIAGSVYFFFVYTLFVDIEIYFGENHFVAIASVCAAIINLVLNHIFIPLFGYIAAGYTTLVSYFLTMVMHYIFMRISAQKHGFTYQLFDLKIIAVLGVCMIVSAAISMMLYNFSIIRLFIAFVAITIIFINKKRITGVLSEMRNR